MLMGHQIVVRRERICRAGHGAPPGRVGAWRRPAQVESHRGRGRLWCAARDRGRARPRFDGVHEPCACDRARTRRCHEGGRRGDSRKRHIKDGLVEAACAVLGGKCARVERASHQVGHDRAWRRRGLEMHLEDGDSDHGVSRGNGMADRMCGRVWPMVLRTHLGRLAPCHRRRRNIRRRVNARHSVLRQWVSVVVGRRPFEEHRCLRHGACLPHNGAVGADAKCAATHIACALCDAVVVLGVVRDQLPAIPACARAVVRRRWGSRQEQLPAERARAASGGRTSLWARGTCHPPDRGPSRC
eukprot:4856030-Prymnesium_polylepis.3